MENINIISELISNLGFPIACVIGLGYFVQYIWKQYTEQMKTNMAQLQERCLAREEKLYEQLTLSEEVNKKAIETLATYSVDIEDIKSTVDDIKESLLAKNQ